MSERVTRDCQCLRARHQHGTSLAYIRDRCRCAACTEANRARSAEWRRKHPDPKPRDFVDAAPTQAHVDELRNTYGASRYAIARAAGVHHNTVYSLSKWKRLERHIADTLLAVSPEQVRQRPTAPKPRPKPKATAKRAPAPAPAPVPVMTKGTCRRCGGRGRGLIEGVCRMCRIRARENAARELPVTRVKKTQAAQPCDEEHSDPTAPRVDYSADACRQRLVAATAEADRWHMTKETL